MAAAAATAAGVVISAYLAKRGNDNAMKHQNRANDQAIAYEREQEAKADAIRADRHQQYLAYLKVKNPDMYNAYMASQQGKAGLPVVAPGQERRGDLRRNPTALGDEFRIAGAADPATAAIVPEGGMNTGTGRTLGEMMGGAPRAARLDESAFGASPVVATAPMPETMAPGAGLAGLADYDWRRNISRPRAMTGRA